MNNKQAKLARKQLERRLSPLREMVLNVPPKGWLKAIRESLGMTDRQLARRMGVVPSRVPTIEKAEISGATTLKTLRAAAVAMNCRVAYAFVPIVPLEDILRERATERARAEHARLDHTMRLENQALLTSDSEADQERMIDLTLAGSLRGLWDE